MTPAHDLLLAHLHRYHDQLVAIRRQRDDLLSNLNQMRKSRDEWKAKAKKRRLALMAMKRSRDMWRHRALIRQEESHVSPDRTVRRIAA